MTHRMSFFLVKSVATILTLVDGPNFYTRGVLVPATIPNSSIFTREVTVHSLEASGGIVIRRTNILHPDRATSHHEHRTRSNNSNHLRRQTVTRGRWSDGRPEGNNFISNMRFLIRHHFGRRLHRRRCYFCVGREIRKERREKKIEGNC